MKKGKALKIKGRILKVNDKKFTEKEMEDLFDKIVQLMESENLGLVGSIEIA